MNEKVKLYRIPLQNIRKTRKIDISPYYDKQTRTTKNSNDYNISKEETLKENSLISKEKNTSTLSFSNISTSYKTIFKEQQKQKYINKKPSFLLLNKKINLKQIINDSNTFNSTNKNSESDKNEYISQEINEAPKKFKLPKIYFKNKIEIQNKKILNAQVYKPNKLFDKKIKILKQNNSERIINSFNFYSYRDSIKRLFLNRVKDNCYSNMVKNFDEIKKGWEVKLKFFFKKRAISDEPL